MNAFVIAAAQKAGWVTVTLMSIFATQLGETKILYVDEEKELVQRVLNEPRLLSNLFKELERKLKTANEGATQDSGNLGKALTFILKVFHGSHVLFIKAQLNYWLLNASAFLTSPMCTKKGEISGSLISTETNNSIHIHVSVVQLRGTSRFPFWVRCFCCPILPKTKSLMEVYHLLGTFEASSTKCTPLSDPFSDDF